MPGILCPRTAGRRLCNKCREWIHCRHGPDQQFYIHIDEQNPCHQDETSACAARADTPVAGILVIDAFPHIVVSCLRQPLDHDPLARYPISESRYAAILHASFWHRSCCAIPARQPPQSWYRCKRLSRFNCRFVVQVGGGHQNASHVQLCEKVHKMGVSDQY